MTTVQYQPGAAAVLVTIDDGKANALTRQALRDLDEALDRAEAEGSAVVLAGRRGRFCAGFDLTELAAGTTESVALSTAGWRLAQRLRGFPRPVVAACSGHAIGIGAFLLLAADYRLGADDTGYRISANEVALGITVPRAAFTLSRRLDRRHVDRALVQAEVFDPSAAVAVGFLDDTVAADVLIATACRKAEALAALGASAFTATKRRAARGVLQSLDDDLQHDERYFQALISVP